MHADLSAGWDNKLNLVFICLFMLSNLPGSECRPEPVHFVSLDEQIALRADPEPVNGDRFVTHGRMSTSGKRYELTSAWDLRENS